MASTFVLKIVIVASCTIFAQRATCAELTPYLQVAPQGQPRGDVGFNFTADALDLRGAITTTLAANTILVTQQLVSSLALTSAWKFETRATFTHWNERTGAPGDGLESRLLARSVLPMLAEIEGLVGRNAMGESRRKLRLKMNDTTVASFLSEPIKLKANASIEEVGAGTASNMLLTGVETSLVQQASPTSASNRIGFKYTAQTGAVESERQAATLSRSWLQNDVLRLGVECELIRDAATLQSVVRFTWQGNF